MSARILIVDDLDINLRLMEARLNAEYYMTMTARSGPEALALCASEPFDLVLLDIMMPDMDGYEVCRRLKADPRTQHLPIVLITALDQVSDRVKGLEAGADDFLTKPVRDLQLFARVRSLTRLKFLTDELRIRAETTVNVVTGASFLDDLARAGGQVVVVGEDEASLQRVEKGLRGEHAVSRLPPDELRAVDPAAVDLVIIDLKAERADPLRLCSEIRSDRNLRRIPILLIVDGSDEAKAARAMELGANDYLLRPVDRNELRARVRTQIKRRRYDESLRQSLRDTIEMAVKDALTGLNNRRFLEAHVPKAMARAVAEDKPLALLIADIDHFKRINDGWGHDAGDAVLREFARRITASIRGSDLACRFGGEEFVVLMPETDGRAALAIAERIRKVTAETPFDLLGESISVTVSAGFAMLEGPQDEPRLLMKRADEALYRAKREGRNRVVTLAA